MNFVKEIKNFVEVECKKSSSKYGYEPFVFHFVPTVECAKKLADELGGDKEIVTIAAWLHDIGSIIYGRQDHNITGAKIAEKKLKELGYPAKKIIKVQKCILNHRGSLQNRRESIEEKIVAEADVMSNFDNITGIFRAALVYENLNQIEARDSVIKKLENKWKQLHFAKSKKIVKPKYEAAMLLLK